MVLRNYVFVCNEIQYTQYTVLCYYDHFGLVCVVCLLYKYIYHGLYRYTCVSDISVYTVYVLMSKLMYIDICMLCIHTPSPFFFRS